MKITPFDDLYPSRAYVGGAVAVYASGSNDAGGDTSGGGDVVGEPGAYSVVGLRSTVSLASNIGGTTVGDVLTIISTSPRLAMFATSSNTGGASFGSNATRVSETADVGALTTSAREDHRHDGIGTITASSSNTMQRGTFNLRPGSNISFGLTDTDGDGELDTLTVNGAAAGGGGGSPTTYALDSYLASSGNSRNDEFATGPGIDAKWTLLGTTPDTVNVDSSYVDRLYLRRNDTSSQLTIYYQSLPTLPCDIFMRADASTFNANYARGGGLALLPATPTTGSKAFYLGFLYNTTQQVAGVNYTTVSGTFGSTAFSTNIAAGPDGLWLRITILSGGTTADVYWSNNGTFWTLALAASALGFTAANAGVAFAPEGQATDLEFIGHSYRVS